jgi:hypothetical protein
MKQKSFNWPGPILSPHIHHWIIIGLFCLLAASVTYPLSIGLDKFTVLYKYTDALLQGWTMNWNIRAFLQGPSGIQNLWNANIFYPYPTTLAFTEHLLPTSFLLWPFILLENTPLVSANLGAILTTALSGYGMYLLVTWLTHNRWAGLIAGIAFAIAPFRLSHINQLHLLTTQWLPFIFLAMARLIKRNQSVDLILLLIFTNLQFISVINYAPLAAIALAIWTMFYLWAYRSQISFSLTARLLVFGIVTLALNWPILRLFQNMSDQMGIVRTLGDARVYGAFIVNYILPVGNSLLYGRLLHLPTHIDYLFPGIGVFVSTFPGIMVLILAVAGIVLSFQSTIRWRLAAIAVLVITLFGFVFSFGANDAAFGEQWSAVVAPLLPYTYLYKVLPVLQGLRVPIRFALLTTFGMAILAGLGFSAIASRWGRQSPWPMVISILIAGVIILEHFPAPLPVESVPYGGAMYAWLNNNTPAESVILELPYYLHTQKSNQELLREYQSTNHWRKLIGGASGFKPAWLVKLGPVLDTFPDGLSLDVLRQLGVQYITLQRDQYDPTAWDNLVGLLPGYLLAIESIHTVGNDLALQLKPPTCQPDLNRIQVDASSFPVLSFTNHNPATFVANPRQVSLLTTPTHHREFLEPLFIAPGQTVTITLPLETDFIPPDWQIGLANLGYILTPSNPSPPIPAAPTPVQDWQPVEIPFANGVTLQAVTLTEPTQPCHYLNLALQWRWPATANAAIRVELLDRYNRVAAGQQIGPTVSELLTTYHALPLVETTPLGPYQLRVRLLDVNGQDIPPLGPDGQPVPVQVSLPVVVRPGVERLSVEHSNVDSSLANGVSLKGVEWEQTQAHPGDWLRFTLTWQVESAPSGDFTVFTQLIGPDGKVRGQHDNPPLGGWYPTSLWRPGEQVTDDYAIRLDPAAPAGLYRLIVGMYNPTSGQRVIVTAGPGAGGDFIEAAQVTVAQP